MVSVIVLFRLFRDRECPRNALTLIDHLIILLSFWHHSCTVLIWYDLARGCRVNHRWECTVVLSSVNLVVIHAIALIDKTPFYLIVHLRSCWIVIFIVRVTTIFDSSSGGSLSRVKLLLVVNIILVLLRMLRMLLLLLFLSMTDLFGHIWQRASLFDQI